MVFFIGILSLPHSTRRKTKTAVQSYAYCKKGVTPVMRRASFLIQGTNIRVVTKNDPLRLGKPKAVI